MKVRTIRLIVTAIATSGAIATACANNTNEPASNPTCPSTDPACGSTDTGFEVIEIADTGETIDATTGGLELDASLPPPDTTTVDTNLEDTTTVDTNLEDTNVEDTSPYDTAVDSAPGETVGETGTVCVPGPTQCTDCIDNDGDGVYDWMDPECTGAIDNDEGSFSTGIPGDNKDACKQDCWFDGNSGAGDDGCVLDGRCLVGSTDKSCPYGGDAWAADPANCPKPSAKCIATCGKYTPKGCDCAGCCEVYDPAGVRHTVKLVGECTYETLNDPAKCPPCGQVAECTNPCGTCEWCLGKTELPPECYPPPPPPPPPDAEPPPPPPPPTCSNGAPVCSPTQPCPLPDKQYCLTGCCVNRVL